MKSFSSTQANNTEGQVSSSLQNHLLIAMPTLTDPYFSHSVTYICEHSERGAMGIVINHPMSLNLHQMLDHLDIPENTDHSQQAVISGGPVQVDRGFVLHKRGQTWESTLPISPEISLTTSKDIIEDIAQDQGPKDNLVALGFAGWSAGQLEEELKANSWLAVPADSDIIFNTPYEKMAENAVAKLGIDLNLIAPTGHA